MSDSEVYEFLQKEEHRVYALVVYQLLCMMVRQETQTCYPSRAYIAKKTGICISMVDVGLEILSRHHIVITAKKTGMHNIYLLPDKSCWRVTPCKPVYATRSTYLWDTQAPIDSILTNNTKLSNLYKSAVKNEVQIFKRSRMKL